jgi:hypothetical protein
MQYYPQRKRRRQPSPPQYRNPLDGIIDSPDECGSYPKYIYFIRHVNARELILEYVYSSVKAAEHKIARVFAEGFSHHLQIVRTYS